MREDLLAAGGDDLREAFEERAAIMEYDGGLTREHAEAGAEVMVLGDLVAAVVRAKEAFEDLVVVEVTGPNQEGSST